MPRSRAFEGALASTGTAPTQNTRRILDARQGAFDEWGVKVNGGPMKGELKILFENHADEEGGRLLGAPKGDRS